MERREVNYWKQRLDNVISDYRKWSLSVFYKLGTSFTAITSYPVIVKLLFCLL